MTSEVSCSRVFRGGREGRKLTDGHLLVAANLARYAAQAVAFFVAARWFGAAIAGHLALALAITAPVFVVANLGLRNLYLTLSPRAPHSAYVRVRTWWSMLAVAVSIALALLSPGLPLILVALVAVSKAIDAVSDFYIAVAQVRDSVSRLALSFIVQPAAAAIGVAVAIALDLSLVTYSLLGVLLPSLVTQVWLWIPGGSEYFRSLRVRSPEKQEIRIVRSGIAVGLSNGVVALSASIPQVALGVWATSADVSRYVVLTYIPVALELLLNPIIQSWLGDVQRAGGRLDDPVRTAIGLAGRTLRRVGVIVVAAGLAVYFAGPLVLGPDYTYAWHEVALACLAACGLPFTFAFMASLTVLRKYRVVLWVNLGAVVVGLLSALVLVPAFGLLGGVLDLLVVQAVRLLGSTWALHAVQTANGRGDRAA